MADIGPVELMGNPALKSEPNLTYEAGFRMQSKQKFSLDTSLFYTRYSRGAFAEPTGITFVGDPRIPVPRLMFQNYLRGESHGAEISTTWSANSRVRLVGLSSVFRSSASRDPASRNVQPEFAAERGYPLFHNQIRSYVNLPPCFELDAALHQVSGMVARRVPGYLRLDLRLGYRPQRPFEFSAGVENLTGKKHIEHISEDLFLPRTAIGRIAYGKLTLRF
jgi:iron complex outermembrane receptor protein